MASAPPYRAGDGQLNGLDPEAYLADVVNHMVGGHPINRLSELLPSNWDASSKSDPLLQSDPTSAGLRREAPPLITG